MVNRNLLRQYDLPEDELQHELDEAFDQNVGGWLPDEKQVFEVNKIVTGRVLNVVGDEVWIDVGYKSEGIIPLGEWALCVDPPQVGLDVMCPLVDHGLARMECEHLTGLGVRVIS